VLKRPLLPVQLRAARALQMLQLGQAPVAMLAQTCAYVVHSALSVCMHFVFSSIQLKSHVISALWGAESLQGRCRLVHGVVHVPSHGLLCRGTGA